MTTMPGVRFAPLGPQTQPRSTGHNIFCVHTMVGSLEGTDSYFRTAGYTGNESHYGTSGTGEIRQWQDNAWTADANYQGSREIVSVENADHGPPFAAWNTSGDNVPPFPPQQREAISRILAWESTTEAHRDCPAAARCYREGIPLVLIPNTLPGNRGVGWHAQGVPGNGLVPGGVVWSTSRGKVCPGRNRIAQIPGIVARAIEIRGGNTDGGFLMALNEDQQAELYNLVKNGRAADNKWQQTIEDLLRGTYNKAAIGTDITAQNRATLAVQDTALGTIETDVSVSRTMLSEQAETISAAIITAIREATGGTIEHAVLEQAVRDAVSSLTIVLPEPDGAA